ncbi:MAG: tetratricopeptide repeat protein [Alphaproteobacteria bacterium]
MIPKPAQPPMAQPDPHPSHPFDLVLTAAAPATRSAFESYGLGFLAYDTTLPAIIEAAKADPDCPGAQLHAAAVHMACESAEGFAKAAVFIAQARRTLRRASLRERAFGRAVLAWHRMDYRRALDEILDLAARWPEDIVALKWGQYHAFNLGDHAALLKLAKRLTHPYPGASYVHGMEAFALEQTHALNAAQDAGLRAVSIEPGDGWAHHAVAHVHETRAAPEDGLAWMEAHAHTWEGRGKFIQHHNWWHTALFRLDLDDVPGALEIYDRRLWGLNPGFAQELAGAIATLWRLELRGVDGGARWQPLAAAVDARPQEHILPFLDLHYVYALARAGTGAALEGYLASMERAAEARPNMACRAVWRGTVLEAARGVAAHGQGRYETAVRHLTTVVDHLQPIGGSHAQRAVFIMTAVDALEQTGAREAARQLRRRLVPKADLAAVA